MEENINEVTLAEVVAELQAQQTQTQTLMADTAQLVQSVDALTASVQMLTLFVCGLFLFKVREWILSAVKRGVKNV